ncbi:NACAD protein, partial [Rhinopomastus cyanomelas]|nr:NACAD protein [Rhinopomastus cyanomelas]
MPTKEEARPQPEGASCDPGGPPTPASPLETCRPPPSSPPQPHPTDPLDTRIVMGEETLSPTPLELRGGSAGGGVTAPHTPPHPPAVPCSFPIATKDPATGKAPTPLLDPDLFFTAPSTPIHGVAGGSRLLVAPQDEPLDDVGSEGLCSPPTSPSGSYMTAEGGSWESSGTGSTSPSCSPNLAAEADGLMMVAEAEVFMESLSPTPDHQRDHWDHQDHRPFTPSEEDRAFAALDEEDEDGQMPEDEMDWEASGAEDLIPAAALPFRGSLLFQAEAVEIAPLPPGTTSLPLCGEEEDEDEEDEEDEEEEEEGGGSTSASFLRSLSETSIPEGADEAFAFGDDTSASSDSAAYDGEEDEQLYGSERHALGTEPASPSAPSTTDVELHLHSG